MGKFKFELNKQGVAELLQGDKMAGVLSEAGRRAAATAGAGFEADTKVIGTRQVCLISADTPEAKRRNLKENVLLKALGSVKV